MILYGIDDNISDLESITGILKKYDIEYNLTEDANHFLEYMSSSKREDIVLSDGHMEEIRVNYDSVNGESKLLNSEIAGYSLLENGYNAVNAKARTRIIFSVFQPKSGISRKIRRENRDGNIFQYIVKSEPNVLTNFENVIKSHIYSHINETMKEKIEYASNILDAWTDDDALKLSFFGITTARGRFRDTLNKITLTKDIEDRCDAIYRIKLNLNSIYGENGLDKEKRWLNRNSEYLNNATPFSVISNGHQHQLFYVLSILEQH